MTTKKNTAESPMPDIPDFTIERLGEPHYPSPLVEYLEGQSITHGFVPDTDRIVYDPNVDYINHCVKEGIDIPSMDVAGPRRKLFFKPSNTRAAIVTCGGICPGLNDMIRALFMELHYRYHVKEVLGIRYGFSGLVPRIGRPPVVITPDMVQSIHTLGGTILGSSRGDQSPAEMVDFLQRERINVLFTIGGDGTQRGALAIAEEVERRKIDISIIGIPKTIDNDISYVERSFGYRTAVSVARGVLNTGHEEARGAYNGVSVVKLMGRNSGFIAAMASIASGDVNVVLVPEVQFDIDGEKGLLRLLERRLEERQHALIVVAEGAGQNLITQAEDEKNYDASGNLKLANIGYYLRDRIKEHFKTGFNAATVKYIDPSYIIRSSPANADDSIFCIQLAQNAVHAAMSGRTKMIVSLWRNVFTHVPMKAVISVRKRLDPAGPEWLAVLESTGQPPSMKN